MYVFVFVIVIVFVMVFSYSYCDYFLAMNAMRFECIFRFKYSHAFVNKYFECSKAASHCQTLCYLLCNISYIDHIIVSYSKLSNKSGN